MRRQIAYLNQILNSTNAAAVDTAAADTAGASAQILQYINLIAKIFPHASVRDQGPGDCIIGTVAANVFTRRSFQRAFEQFVGALWRARGRSVTAAGALEATCDLCFFAGACLMSRISIFCARAVMEKIRPAGLWSSSRL